MLTSKIENLVDFGDHLHIAVNGRETTWTLINDMLVLSIQQNIAGDFLQDLG